MERLVARWRIPRLAVPHDLLHVVREVFQARGPARFLFRGLPPRRCTRRWCGAPDRGSDDGERLRIALDDDFGASLDTFQDRGKVAHRISFVYVQHSRIDIWNDTVYYRS